MSAWLVHRVHVDLIVAAVADGTRDGVLPGYLPKAMRSKIGALMYLECVRSVQYRYPDCVARPDHMPGSPMIDYRKWRDPIYRLNAPELFQAVACYDYQACEHPQYRESTAGKLCTQLLERLKEYRESKERNAAPWGYDPGKVTFALAELTPQGRELVQALRDGVSGAREPLADYLHEVGVLKSVKNRDFAEEVEHVLACSRN